MVGVLNLCVFSAKHLATSNCKTAYPSEDYAALAAIPVQEPQSMETSAGEAMAKAYHGKPSRTTEKVDKTGELAFLGLQRNKDSGEKKEESVEDKVEFLQPV